MMVVGSPTPQQAQSFSDNLVLKNTAVELLKAGNSCSQVFNQVKETAQINGISLWEEAGIGNGIGTSEREAPYLNQTDQTVLQEGMVIVLSVCTYGPEREIICSKDTYEITSGEPRLLSWYKNWDKLYKLFGNTARHG